MDIFYLSKIVSSFKKIFTKYNEDKQRSWLFITALYFVLLIAPFIFSNQSSKPNKNNKTFQELVKEIASGKTLPDLPKQEQVKQLKIISARYGAKDKWFDVTKEVQDKVNENHLAIYASNIIAGDPIFGYPKQLEVVYILNDAKKEISVREGVILEIPRTYNPYDELRVIETSEELVALAENCPAEIGFYGINFSTGKTIEYQADQPACMASIVKLFVLLEIMRQEEEGILRLSDPMVTKQNLQIEKCSISDGIDKMIGQSDNEATGYLANRVGYKNVNALVEKLSLEGLSKNILPEPGGLDKALDRRVYKTRIVPKTELPPQHGTAKGIVQFFQLLHEKKLINESISKKVLEALERNPKYFAPRATPQEYKSVGKGGSVTWIRPSKPEYNMAGWGLYIYNENNAIAFCLWFEWFPKDIESKERSKWISGISDCIVNLLLKQ